MKKPNGFLLIELPVAIGIFSIAVLLAVSSFLFLNSSRKISSDKQSILNEFRFAIELLGREIAGGSAFSDDCENGCPSIVFATKIRPDVPLKRVEYSLDAATGIIMRAEQKTFGLCYDIPFAPECSQPLTSARAKVENLKFFVNNKETGSQPIINVVIDGRIEEERFQIASTHSPRGLQEPSAEPPSDNIRPEIEVTSPTASNDTCPIPPDDPGTPFTTSATETSLGGIATDNIGVTEVKWWNINTDENGLADISGLPNWETLALRLSPFITNKFGVEAKDAGGNVSDPDSICIDTTAPPPTPFINPLSVGSFCTSDGFPYIYFEWSPIIAGARYHIERCVGTCTPNTEYDFTWGNSYSDYGSPNEDDDGNPVGLGGSLVPLETYSYRLRGHNHNYPIRPYEFTDYSSNVVSATARNDCVPSSPTDNFSLDRSRRIISVAVCKDPVNIKTSQETTITVIPSSGFDENVDLSASGGPFGSEFNFFPSTLTFPYSSGSLFSVTIPDNTTVDLYPITVTGSGGGESRSINVYLDVKGCGFGEI